MQSLVVYSSKKLKHVVACGDKVTVDAVSVESERGRRKEDERERTIGTRALPGSARMRQGQSKWRERVRLGNKDEVERGRGRQKVCSVPRS